MKIIILTCLYEIGDITDNPHGAWRENYNTLTLVFPSCQPTVYGECLQCLHNTQDRLPVPKACHTSHKMQIYHSMKLWNKANVLTIMYCGYIKSGSITSRIAAIALCMLTSMSVHYKPCIIYITFSHQGRYWIFGYSNAFNYKKTFFLMKCAFNWEYAEQASLLWLQTFHSTSKILC